MRNDYRTPQALFDALDREFHFTLDACADADNAKCRRFFTAEDDGLAQDWSGQTVWMNPPYDNDSLARWMQKAYAMSQGTGGTTVVALVPVRADMAWWHDYAMRGNIRFIRERLHFGLPDRPPHRAPFASAIVVFDKRMQMPPRTYPALRDPRPPK